MINYSLQATITIDLQQMQSTENNYDNSLPHPMSSSVIIRDNGVKKYEVLIGQLLLLIALLDENSPNAGKFLDHCAMYGTKMD